MQTAETSEKTNEPTERSREVFIVHGHDTLAKAEVARFIEHAGLTAVILHDLPDAGQTIIEKFERHGGSAGFAVILLTPDDVGGPDKDHLRDRARQNVIGEMFWFAGKLGRKHVCALKKGDVEMPSDFPVLFTQKWTSQELGSKDCLGNSKRRDTKSIGARPCHDRHRRK